MPYLIHSPWWLRKIYPKLVWQMPAKNNTVYLSFDDGPHPIATPFVLHQLAKFGMKATFFCIGKNVELYPEIFEQIKAEGHAIGNHTMHHANGWKTDNKSYLKEIKQADELIHSNLFRPPYGRIKRKQIQLLVGNRQLTESNKLSIANCPICIVMWSILSGDFDEKINGQKCFENVIKHVKPGSIIVFHDSVKAFSRLEYALPKTLEWLASKGFQSDAIIL